MRALLTSLLLLAASLPGARAQITTSPRPDPQLEDYTWLRLCPSMNSTHTTTTNATWWIMGSRDGTNWTPVVRPINYSGAFTPDEIYGPGWVYYNGRFIVAYDSAIIANVAGHPRAIGLAVSTNLADWYRVGASNYTFTLTNTTDAQIYGPDFYVEDNLYLLLPVEDTVEIDRSGIWITWATDATLTNWASAVKILEGNYVENWIYKENGLYYMGVGSHQIFTNAVLTNTGWALYGTMDIATSGEATHFYKWGTNYVLWESVYGAVGHSLLDGSEQLRYYTSTGLLTGWTYKGPIREAGLGSGHGNPIRLETDTLRNVARKAAQDNLNPGLAETVQNFHLRTTSTTPVTVYKFPHINGVVLADATALWRNTNFLDAGVINKKGAYFWTGTGGQFATNILWKAGHTTTTNAMDLTTDAAVTMFLTNEPPFVSLKVIGKSTQTYWNIQLKLMKVHSDNFP